MPKTPPTAARFIHFQRDQDGVLTLKDAADFLGVNVLKIHKWAGEKRIAFCEHRSRRYFGIRSLREWGHLRQTFQTFQQVEKLPIWLREREICDLNSHTNGAVYFGSSKKRSSA